MENAAADPFGSFSSSKDERVEPAVDLLEECWFYENLLNRRTKMMLRCFSDPSPPYFNQDLMTTNASTTIEEAPKHNGSVHCNLGRTQSLSPNAGRDKQNGVIGEQLPETHGSISCDLGRTVSLSSDIGLSLDTQSNIGAFKTIQGSSSSSQRKLQRTPSLPPCIGRKTVNQEKQSDPNMCKLTCGASANANPLNTLPIRPRPSERFHIPRYRPPHKTEPESYGTDGWKEVRRRYLNQRKARKSQSDLEVEELQGFKDLGFQFDKEGLSPDVISIIPGLQERKRIDEAKERKPYLSEAWVAQACAPQPPPLPTWAAKKSARDMKAQIKFWARAVASNVHQEC